MLTAFYHCRNMTFQDGFSTLIESASHFEAAAQLSILECSESQIEELAALMENDLTIWPRAETIH